MNVKKLLRAVFLNDLVTASSVVIAVSLVTAFFWLVLSWMVYQDRYGIGFADYLKMLFG